MSRVAWERLNGTCHLPRWFTAIASISLCTRVHSPELTYYTCTRKTIPINYRPSLAWCVRLLVSWFSPSFSLPNWECPTTGNASLPGVSISVGLKLIHQSCCFTVLPASDATCSVLISLLSLQHHLAVLPCELLLQPKVTDPIPHVIKDPGSVSMCGPDLLKNLWKSVVSLTPCSLGPVTLISAW